MHFEEQFLMKQQLADAEKIMADLEALYKLSEPPLKEYVSVFRRLTEWAKKAPLSDGEWQPLAVEHTKMLEMALKIAKKMISE